MTRLALILAVATGIAAPAVAEPIVTPLKFERDGFSYVGTVTRDAGETSIVGQEVRFGTPFALRVGRSGLVTGTFAGMPVRYAAPAPSPVRLSSR